MTVRTGSTGTPEHIVRNRTPIPQKPDIGRLRSLIGEIGRVTDPDLRTLLQHMVDEWGAQLDVVWEALDILDKRFQEFEDEDIRDTVYTEQHRETQNRDRTVSTDDGEIEIDLVDIITKVIYMKGNKGGRLKLVWNEPFPG